MARGDTAAMLDRIAALEKQPGPRLREAARQWREWVERIDERPTGRRWAPETNLIEAFDDWQPPEPGLRPGVEAVERWWESRGWATIGDLRRALDAGEFDGPVLRNQDGEIIGPHDEVPTASANRGWVCGCGTRRSDEGCVACGGNRPCAGEFGEEEPWVYGPGERVAMGDTSRQLAVSATVDRWLDWHTEATKAEVSLLAPVATALGCNPDIEEIVRLVGSWRERVEGLKMDLRAVATALGCEPEVEAMVAAAEKLYEARDLAERATRLYREHPPPAVLPARLAEVASDLDGMFTSDGAYVSGHGSLGESKARILRLALRFVEEYREALAAGLQTAAEVEAPLRKEIAGQDRLIAQLRGRIAILDDKPRPRIDVATRLARAEAAIEELQRLVEGRSQETS